MFLRGLLFELCWRSGSVGLYNDNLSALQLTEHPGFHARTEHIDVRHHSIRELCKLANVTVCQLSTKEMPADVLSMGLKTASHVECVQSFRICLGDCVDMSLSV